MASAPTRFAPAKRKLFRGNLTLAAEPTGFLWNVPMFVLAGLVLNHFGRPFDFILAGYKIPLVISLLGVVTVLSTRALKGALSGAGLALVALAAWMAACVPFSTWRGGSGHYALYFAALQVVLFLLATSAPRSFRDIKLVIYVTLVCGLLYMAVATTGQATPSSRFDLGGTFGNSNDFAQFAGFLMPLLVFALQRLRNPILKGVILLLAGGFLVWIIASTGSRAAVVASLAMLLVYLIYATAAQRIALLTISGVVVLMLAAVLPSVILNRFGTVLESFGSEKVLEQQSSEAVASALERRQLIEDAINMTVHHPLFGVGPGEFEDFRFQFMDLGAHPGHKRFFPSHNAYLQVASEEGVPGFVFYVLFFGATIYTLTKSIRLNRSQSHADWQIASQLGVCLLAAFVYFAVFAIFLTCERYPQQYLAGGLAIALLRISKMRVSEKNPAPVMQRSAQNSTVQQRFGQTNPAPAFAGQLGARPNSALKRPR